MVPYKEGGANNGHSCIKGRFAWGYAKHKDRLSKPLIRDDIKNDWKEVEWDEAIRFAARRFKEIQNEYGTNSIGGITSARTTNEEAYIVQKLIRTAFGNNNVDTCARVCHSPTGYGLNHTFGTSAGTQNFETVQNAHVKMVIVKHHNPSFYYNSVHNIIRSKYFKLIKSGNRLPVYSS